MLAEEHPAPRPLPLTGGGARGRDPNLAGHGREEHHITPQKKSNRIRLPSIPAKERMAKAKDPKARGIGKSISPHHRKGEHGLAGIVEDGIGIAAGERGVMTWRRTYEGWALVTFHTSRVE